MIIAAEFVESYLPAAHQIEDVYAAGCRHLVLNPVGIDLSLTKHPIEYRAWLHAMLDQSQKFFSIVGLPMHFLGTREVTDEVVTRYICQGCLCGESKVRERILGVHLMQGRLTVQDYLLRIYGLLRNGFTYFLIVDDLQAHSGTYKDAAYDAAMAVWTQRTREHVPIIRRTPGLWSMLNLQLTRRAQFAVVPYSYVVRRKRCLKLWSKYENSRSVSKKSSRAWDTI